MRTEKKYVERLHQEEKSNTLNMVISNYFFHSHVQKFEQTS